MALGVAHSNRPKLNGQNRHDHKTFAFDSPSRFRRTFTRKRLRACLLQLLIVVDAWRTDNAILAFFLVQHPRAQPGFEIIIIDF